MSWWIIWEKNFQKWFVLFGWWAKNVSTFGKKKLGSLWKLHSTSPQEHFEEKSWRFGFFWSLNGLFSNICLKTCGTSVRTALYVPREAISRKQVFIGWLIVCFLISDFYRKAVDLSAKKSRLVCQTSFYFSTRTFWGKKLILFFFGARTDFSPNSGKKLVSSLSELHSIVPQEHFEETS